MKGASRAPAGGDVGPGLFFAKARSAEGWTWTLYSNQSALALAPRALLDEAACDAAIRRVMQCVGAQVGREGAGALCNAALHLVFSAGVAKR